MGGINHQTWVVYYCYTHIKPWTDLANQHASEAAHVLPPQVWVLGVTIHPLDLATVAWMKWKHLSHGIWLFYLFLGFKVQCMQFYKILTMYGMHRYETYAPMNTHNYRSTTYTYLLHVVSSRCFPWAFVKIASVARHGVGSCARRASAASVGKANHTWAAQAIEAGCRCSNPSQHISIFQVWTWIMHRSRNPSENRRVHNGNLLFYLKSLVSLWFFMYFCGKVSLCS